MIVVAGTGALNPIVIAAGKLKNFLCRFIILIHHVGKRERKKRKNTPFVSGRADLIGRLVLFHHACKERKKEETNFL
jgi:hypothetical protein